MTDQSQKQTTHARYQPKRGATLTGYGLVVGLIAIVSLGAITSIGGQVEGMFTTVAERLDGTAATASSGSGSGAPAATPEATPTFIFASHTFTNCSATGRTGPAENDCETEYTGGGASWASQNANFSVSGGIQNFTVPVSGNYTITATGAQGGQHVNGVGNYGAGDGGEAARVSATFALTQGQVIEILVGQMGLEGTSNCHPMGGGGGSFVVDQSSGDALLVAGGGGGREPVDGAVVSTSHASTGTAGNDGVDEHGAGGCSVSGMYDGEGGTAGLGGSCGAYFTGGGGGFLGDGGGGSVGGQSFVNGGLGGNDMESSNADGGFGGGGAGRTTCSYGAGGGGGYSGGGGGNHGHGGGGGSYIAASGSSPSSSTGFTGHGQVTITLQ